MKVVLKVNVLWPPGKTTPAGTTLDVSDAMGLDWIKRGLAAAVAEPPPLKTPEPFKRGRR
jgi:hypothetical protein